MLRRMNDSATPADYVAVEVAGKATGIGVRQATEQQVGFTMSRILPNGVVDHAHRATVGARRHLTPVAQWRGPVDR